MNGLTTQTAHQRIPLERFWNLLEEIRALNFLLRRTPRHVVRKQMREDRLCQRDGETTGEKEAAHNNTRQSAVLPNFTMT